eukprot:TRINITY_DN34910_c0_g1_i1.p1 TRINITY_DN34910_c0_g1~~TRINITY_DN34910_c0_g1_i1.p1  ORF type:complete len:236 (-),score=21.51 TRINITY_DN34910_c0_g1_i1:131-787(-)
MTMTAPFKLYVFRGSANCVGAMIVAKECNAPHTIVDVDLMKGEHLKPEYLEVNPRHQVPAMKDKHGITVIEGNSICKYICSGYTADSQLYPTALQARRICDMALDWRLGSLYPKMADLAYPVLGFGGEKDRATCKKIAEEDVEFFAKFFLDGLKDFICGNAVSIADIQVATTMIFFDCIADFKWPEKVIQWRKSVRASLKSWDECAGGCQQYADSKRC